MRLLEGGRWKRESFLKQIAIAQLEETHFWKLESFKLYRALFKLYLLSLPPLLKMGVRLKYNRSLVCPSRGWTGVCVCERLKTLHLGMCSLLEGRDSAYWMVF